MNPLVLIPARYESSRFRGKPLAMIGDQSMIERVYHHCHAFSPHTWVVTDSLEIENHVKEFGQVVRVDDHVESGTERIYLAWKRYLSTNSYDLIINVQGDEPLLGPDDLQRLADFHSTHHFDITTLVKKMGRDSLSDFENPNKVKAVYRPSSGECLYFSRAQVPFHRAQVPLNWYLHIGVYSYRPEALETFCQGQPSDLEKIEMLEQLRALEMGLSLGAVETDKVLIGVDTPDDLKKVMGVLL